MPRPVLLSVAIAVAVSAVVLVPTATQAQRAADWVIGPIIRGKNYSQGMPLQPRPARQGWRFDFPAPDRDAGHVHYVTFHPGSLAGKSRIVARYRIDAPPGTRFVPQESPDLPATLSLYFQRRGDNWGAKGRYQYYRWYAPSATMQKIAPGEYRVEVRFDDPDWISVLGRKAADAPDAFRAAMTETDQVGLVFGSASARGHGVFATRPARFTLLDFDIL
ncbi:MAG: hypothetical protein U0S50_02075 [Sphingopyxis sp.]|uniref:hypothetical protein n=1 Tax=Sphingopyxis sp. TaxID=1908224 RepID=UPI002AB8BC0A|nr:hypothetical protein [Sphingopyxis sp.]MDZ3830588.1 hypothetical protein [Sphingopyxis sp.]